MKITITGRKVHLKDDFKERVNKKISKFDRIFGENAEAHVTVTLGKNWQTVEVTINKDGKFYRSESTKQDMNEALDEVIDCLGRQLRKYKTKLNKALRSSSISDYMADIGESVQEEDSEFKIVRSKKFPVKPLDVEEAILEMNLIGHQFYMFRNFDTNEVNVVYKRKDGNYGLLEPQ